MIWEEVVQKIRKADQKITILRPSGDAMRVENQNLKKCIHGLY